MNWIDFLAGVGVASIVVFLAGFFGGRKDKGTK